MSKGEYFVDEIYTGTEIYGVFHTDIKPGHCFATFSSEEQAEEHAQMLNRWNEE